MRVRPAICLLALTLLTGCTSAARITAVVTGGIAGAATASPAVGFAVGVATDAATNYAVRYYGRAQQGSEQDAIAKLAGELPVGVQADWKIHHFIPLNDEHGELHVVKDIDSPLATCKRVIFSVDEGKPPKRTRSWYSTDICKQDGTWKWAAAEPAVPRWGFLQ